MAEASIAAAISKLDGNTIAERTEGLDVLKRLLGERRNASSGDGLGDDVFHKIFEFIYRIVSKHKPPFVKSSSAKTARGSAGARLEVAAAALRLTVEVGASRIKFKTALSVLDHIVDTLPLTDGSLCTPLKTDYLKSFKILLDYAPHGEHMRPRQWHAYVDFALDCLSTILDDTTVQDQNANSREASVALRSDVSLSLRNSQRSTRSIGKERATLAEEAVAALKSLTSVTNARLMTRAKVIAESLHAYLNVTGTGQEDAFETLNNLMLVSVVQDVTFTQNCIVELAPTIRRLWISRSGALREQMVITLFICRHLFLAPAGTWPTLPADTLEPLLTKLLSDYSTRSDRDIMHFDDMQPLLPSEIAPLRLKYFKPIRNSARAVNCWLTLDVIGSLIVGLSRNRRPSSPNDDVDEMPRKRQKVQSHLEQIFELSIAGTAQEKLTALQIILFVIERLTHPELAALGFDRLIPDLNSEDSAMQTWIFLIFARLAAEDALKPLLVFDLWTQTWDAARRAMTTTSTTRASCHALSVLLATGVLGPSLTASVLEDSLFGAVNNGPASLTDTSLILMINVLQSRYFESEKRFEGLCLKIIGWLTVRWILPTNLDRLHNAYLVSQVRPELLFGVLTSICGFSEAPSFKEDWSPVHPSFRTAMITSTYVDFAQYLFAIPGFIAPNRNSGQNEIAFRQVDASTVGRLLRAVIDFLGTQLRGLLRSCIAISAERSSNIGTDIIQIMTTASTVMSAVWTRCDGQGLGFTQPPVLLEIRRFLADSITSHKNADTRRELVTAICACVVSIHTELCRISHVDWDDEHRAVLAFALDLAHQGMATSVANDLSDLELFEEEKWDSQATQSSQAGTGTGTLRIDLPTCQDTHELLARYLIQLTTAIQVSKSQGVLDSSAATLVYEEIVGLDPVLLIGARGAVLDFLALETGTSRTDAVRLVERLGQVCLQQEAFERCEPALCFCLQMLRSVVDLWSADEDDELSAAAFDIYDWFLSTALEKRIASPRVLSSLADLLDALLLKNPSYGGEDVPSPRTSLLNILEVSDPARQYRMADQLSHVFEKYVLTQHDAIFDDVIGKLPSDPDNREGIAVRLYIVSHLGARWHTVLRQATYHIFETVAHVQATTKLAHECILQTCKELDLQKPRELFKLFSPQIFYTWFSQERLSNMPFEPFGYASLQQMADDNIAELVGQVALRGTAHAEDMAQLVGKDWNTLLAENFANAEAYTLASETSVPKQDRLYDGSEKLVRKQLGSDMYLQRLRECFPDIVVQLISSLQDDRGIEKALPAPNLTLWQEMVDQSEQQGQLPLAQQPCFRARCLLEQLNYLCLRMNVRQEDIWTPAFLIYLFRRLLDRARPALGPLHTCSVIRKLRIVISLAGPIACEGYPLEMMLHTLRQYLTLFECAADAMGIYRFLLRHAAPYLSTRPSFVAGLSVAIFASLSGFIKLSQDTTTQESHFQATMTKAQEFRAFLSQYLDSLQLEKLDAEAAQRYQDITRHAKNILQHGTSAQSTHEGQLLHALLMDQSSKNPLLSRLHFELSLEIFCQRFSVSPDSQDDIFAHDDDASRVFTVLENILKKLELCEEFQIWAAQIVGRGFIMRGLAPWTYAEMRQSKQEISLLSNGWKGFTAVSSYTSILRHLLEVLWKSSYPASTFAENTLQLVFSTLSSDQERHLLEPNFDKSLVQDLRFVGFPCPVVPRAAIDPSRQDGTSQTWAAGLVGQISEAAATDPVLPFLNPLIAAVPEAAEIVLPYAVHLILLHQTDKHQVFCEKLSEYFSEVLSPRPRSLLSARPLVLKTLLYLRQCQLPHETHMAERNSWLEIDLGRAAVAASDCQMWHEALLLLELQYSQAKLQTGRSSRKSLIMTDNVPLEVVSKIYESVDDPDFFYGRQQTYDLQSVIRKMGHEGASQKSLSFHSALLDSQLRASEQEAALGDVALMTASNLSAANMQGISEAVKQHFEDISKDNPVGTRVTPHHQWDLLSSKASSTPSTDLVSLFRNMHTVSNKESCLMELDRMLLDLGHTIRVEPADKTQASRRYSKLAVLAEARQIVGEATAEGLESTCVALAARNEHIKLADFDILSPVLGGREAAFAAIRRNPRLQASFSLNSHQALLFEIQVTRQSLNVASSFEVPQFSLNRAMFLSELNCTAQNIGLNVDVAVNYDLARTLWAHEETAASIGILEQLKDRGDTAEQAIAITRADILTDLGHKIADARLGKPDEIIERYLAPAILELHGPRIGSAAGRVFHNFAAFCDMQLQDSNNLDDFARISKNRERKQEEVLELERMAKKSKTDQQKHTLKAHLVRARNWLKLDDEEWQRVARIRNSLVLQCLENYLLSMTASDDYPNDTLRFVALWLDQAESATANTAVHKHLGSVPTMKFARLVNQLTSRLLDLQDDFQKLLKDLMFRICSDHPYHSLYQVFATSKSKAPSGDDVAASRWAAANKLTERIRQHSTSSAVWTAVHNTCVALNKVAVEPLPERESKTDPKTLQLRKLRGGPGLEAQITKTTSRIPPPTMAIALRKDRDYSRLPTSVSIGPELSIAGGISAPKIATITASDGSRHKLLLKGGNDDLRQDAIMEQVFEQVSNLLSEHRMTRQRNLGIRTYKVIPLTKNSGIIEFVQNTIPLNEYLLPAHARYYPKDYKSSRARKDVGDAQSKPLDQRVRAYQTVAANFHPVMRFFFMENFLDPDEWFYKRLNYSRSTAAVSILGHVLGLGDRHGHNILLDEKTGEVVHIDLGVAFEAGRVLPVPEVVPFRLTRDLVDGMGLTGVEGVFRRCCNFTLEALRQDQEAIMTILDVLRYDPLYSWSISPFRLQKMQENNEQAAASMSAARGTNAASASMAANDPSVALGAMAAKREEAEPSEADRALTVVAKKLGKALSVEATVNGLIRQATDERNLAVLYCGWAAYV